MHRVKKGCAVPLERQHILGQYTGLNQRYQSVLLVLSAAFLWAKRPFVGHPNIAAVGAYGFKRIKIQLRFHRVTNFAAGLWPARYDVVFFQGQSPVEM